ncbi:probable G-protein coupled receptor 139 [Colossoma macropomum]|uniref:probable G-protein coupled receptor 139 n=1 Tax=Colossoma macropomum TaxID=42526 RepID=UPI001864183E|nr:probable G-protein coupled receptor 139 [Colossoma macropomum]
MRGDMAAQEHWMIHLQRVYYPVLAAIGIPSNIASFLIFWRRKCMLSKSSALYLMAIAVADTAVLLFIVVLELIVKYYTVEPFWFRDPWCSMRDVFNYGAYNVSTWLVVVFTAERFLAITTWSLKNRICNPRCALRVIGVVFVVGHLLAVPYYWAYVSIYSQDAQHWLCIYRPDSPLEYALTMVSLQTTLSHILPFIFIAVLNGLTLRQISLSNRVHAAAEVCKSTSGHKVAPLLRSRKRKSAVLLVTVSMTFVLLSTTRSITQLILRTKGLHVDRDDYSLDINVAADIGTMLSLSNAAVNMYLYACTQTKFRQEFIACVKHCLWRGCLVRNSPSSCTPGHA